jgi:hypothetical protein
MTRSRTGPGFGSDRGPENTAPADEAERQTNPEMPIRNQI